VCFVCRVVTVFFGFGWYLRVVCCFLLSVREDLGVYFLCGFFVLSLLTEGERGLLPAAAEGLLSARAAMNDPLFFAFVSSPAWIIRGRFFSWSLGRFRCAMRGAVWGAGGFSVVVFRVICWIPMEFLFLFASAGWDCREGAGGRGGYIL